MKTTSLATTVLSFLLLALACTKPMMGDPLKDINGNDVKSTLDYFLVPADGNSSGNGLTSGRVQSRPREVILESSYPIIRNGSKIRFSPADSSNGEIIQEGKDLNVIFSELTHNGNSVVWSLDNYDTSLENWLVSTAGTVGDYGGKTLLNWFHFHKPGTAGDGTYAYLIHFCPPENINIPSICYFLGIFTPDEEPGSRYLALVLTDKNALPVKLIPTSISPMKVDPFTLLADKKRQAQDKDRPTYSRNVLPPKQQNHINPPHSVGEIPDEEEEVTLQRCRSIFRKDSAPIVPVDKTPKAVNRPLGVDDLSEEMRARFNHLIPTINSMEAEVPLQVAQKLEMVPPEQVILGMERKFQELAYMLSVNKDLLVSYVNEGEQAQRMQSELSKKEAELKKALDKKDDEVRFLKRVVNASKHDRDEATRREDEAKKEAAIKDADNKCLSKKVAIMEAEIAHLKVNMEERLKEVRSEALTEGFERSVEVFSDTYPDLDLSFYRDLIKQSREGVIEEENPNKVQEENQQMPLMVQDPTPITTLPADETAKEALAPQEIAAIEVDPPAAKVPILPPPTTPTTVPHRIDPSSSLIVNPNEGLLSCFVT